MIEITEVTVGPFTFQWERERSEMIVCHGEEAAGMIEVLGEEDWQLFESIHVGSEIV